MKRRYTLGLIAILIVTSCSKGEAYFEFNNVDKGEWTGDNRLEFVVDSSLFVPSNSYDLQLDVIYSSVYPYHDLWLSISHNLMDTLFVEDTLKVTLIDKYGKRLGSGNAGLYQLSLPYKSYVRLDSAYSYSISVGHIMRDSKLKGIEKIGLKISESGIIENKITRIIEGL